MKAMENLLQSYQAEGLLEPGPARVLFDEFGITPNANVAAAQTKESGQSASDSK